jgi:probable F420-dependent oxidoreductase
MVKFGIVNVGLAATGEATASLGQRAEAAGFESAWTVEHVVVPAGYESRYPYHPSGKMPGHVEVGIPDPLVWLTWVAASTTTLNVATGILILPQRNPVVLAKEVATLDSLSGGRAILGVGVGWLKEEMDAIGGPPFEDRAAVTEEHIAALRELWREAEPTFRGRWSSFERAQLYPKPARPGGVPIVIGGHSRAAARRAGRIGDGFYPTAATVEELDELFTVARTAAVDAGRDPGDLELTCATPPNLDDARRRQDLGVDRLLIAALGRTADDQARQIETFAAEVIARV